MRVYSVDAADGEPSTTFATKSKAIAFAKDMAANVTPSGSCATVEEVTLVKLDKAAIVRLINIEGGYVESARVIATFDAPLEGEGE